MNANDYYVRTIARASGSSKVRALAQTPVRACDLMCQDILRLDPFQSGQDVPGPGQDEEEEAVIRSLRSRW
jgi:hypothetical protein